MGIFDKFKSRKVIKELYTHLNTINKGYEETINLVKNFGAENLKDNESVRTKVELNFEQLENEMLNLGWLFDKHDAHVRDNILTRPFGTKGRYLPNQSWYNKVKLNKEYDRDDKSIRFEHFFSDINNDLKLFRQFLSMDENNTKIRKIVTLKVKNLIKNLIDGIETTGNKQLAYYYITINSKEINHTVEDFTINNDDFESLTTFDLISIFSRYMVVKTLITIVDNISFSVGVKPIAKLPEILIVSFSNGGTFSIDNEAFKEFVDEFYQLKVDFE